MFFVIKHDHATNTTSCNDMTRIKTCSTQIGTLSFCDCIRRVFKECDTWKSFTNSFPIWCITNKVWQKDTLCFWGNNFFEIFYTWYICVKTHITKNWFETKLNKWCDRCRKSTCGGNNF